MVSDEGDVAKYAHYCYNLLMVQSPCIRLTLRIICSFLVLQDDSILFITLRAKFAEHVSKVVAVAEQTKMMLHREGADEVHQYVRYDEIKEAPGKKGPRIIKLDGPPEYVHLFSDAKQ